MNGFSIHLSWSTVILKYLVAFRVILQFYTSFCSAMKSDWIIMSSLKPSTCKKQKIVKECHVFQDKWELSYIRYEMKGTTASLECNKPINVLKNNTKRIRKVSTDCKYFRCSAAVVILRMCTDFPHLLARLRRHYEDIRSYLRFVLCV
jgi:hypothetical protein